MSIFQHLLYGIRQDEVVGDNRYKVQVACANIIAGVNGSHSATWRNYIENEEMRLVDMIFIALNFRTDALALDSNPIFASDHAKKLFLDIIFVRHFIVYRTVVYRKPQVARTDNVFKFVFQQPPLMPYQGEGSRATIDFLGDNIRLFVVLHLRHILNSGFVCLRDEIWEAALLLGFTKENTSELFEAHEPRRMPLLMWQRIVFCVHSGSILLNS